MNRKQLILIGFIVGVILALLFISQAGATKVEKIDVCHCEQPDSESPFQCQTLNLPQPGVDGHLNQHDADYEGACVEPTPTDVPEEEPTPTEIPEPTDEPKEEVTPTVKPTTPPSPYNDGLSDGKTDGKSDGKGSVPQEYSCEVAGNCGNK